MTRVVGLLIVVTLAAPPAGDILVCLAWCDAAAHAADRAGCHDTARHAASLVSGGAGCSSLSDGTPFLREETRRDALTLATHHGGPIARFRLTTFEGGRIGYSPDAPRPLTPPGRSTVLRI